ncbi:hypothetical protein DNH61_03810 [Paenibacillus sambharensis]|uniref:Uncharacterized protein n=2 Tax=Paenibacillus sambharensis TaxID=1803190 RepID=A0A2W1LRV8_9BACL|nr:hypothetical protein DNH61_03810 [Paenibacillus sambharensis]
MQLGPEPPRPEITYGEFPITLVYELKGERKEIKDAVICEFDGFGANEATGKFREWKMKLESGQEEITLLRIDDSEQIYSPSGFCHYYMDDLSEGVSYDPASLKAALLVKRGGSVMTSRISEKELFDKYNIKLISSDFSQPITNSYK